MDIIGTKIRKVTDTNLIKLLVGHYFSKRDKKDGGILSKNELDIAVEEANKRRIAGRVDEILKADKLIFYSNFDLERTNLIYLLIITYIEKGLEDFIRVADIYSLKWLAPKDKEQKEYRDKIIKDISPIGKGLFDTDWIIPLEKQLKGIKMNILFIQKAEERVKYDIVRGEVKEKIEESRFNIGAFFNMLDNKVNMLLYDIGDSEQDLDYTVYRLAFFSLPEADQEQFNKIYSEVEHDPQYLDQEEVIFNLLNGKGELTEEAKEKIANLIAKRSYNKYAKEHQLYHYYACIPLIEVARHYLTSKGIEIKGKQVNQDQTTSKEDTATYEAIEKTTKKFAKDNNITIEKILRTGFLSWIDKGLFKQYTPLALSNQKELFNKWLKTRNQTKETLTKLIEKGELKTVGNGKNITGESLFNLKGQPDFEKIIEREFYNKEFRDYVKGKIGIDEFTNFLT
ncbi:hypothetical protein CO049_02025, partial [Candidatus Roizmanbacteria bacterium CG_4_9_14_0_2_um_filter_36_12]